MALEGLIAPTGTTVTQGERVGLQNTADLDNQKQSDLIIRPPPEL